MDFVCPICRGELSLAESNTKKCPSGHSFDRARAGYYNLLIGNSGGTHGDNREMVEARRAFLSRGHYAPLRDRVAAAVLRVAPPLGAVLDAGAGEGYYTLGIEEALRHRDGDSRVLAFDISKEAMKYSARKSDRISFAVASSYAMPVADGSVDVAVSIFAPLAEGEVRRILPSGGHFVLVFPDREHLFGLKSAIYKTPYKNEPHTTALSGFELISDEAVEYELNLTSADEVRELFMMTPYAYRTGREDRERVLSLSSLSTAAAFRILTYKRL